MLGLDVGQPAARDDERRRTFFAVSVCFFALFFYYSFFSRFTVLIYQHYGLSAKEIGIMSLLGIIASIPGSSFWGYVADWTGRRKLTLVCCISACAGLQTLLCLAPLLPSHEWRFAYCCMVNIAYTMVRGNDYGQLRGLTMRALSRCGRPDAYGTLRLWGAVSYGMAHPLIGFMMDFSSYSILFLFVGNAVSALFTVLSIIFLLRTSWTDEDTEESSGLVASQEPASDRKVSMRHLIRIICARCEIVAWLLCAAAQAMGMQHVFTFLFMFMGEQFHSSQLLMGLSVTLTVIFEIPIFAYGEQLVPKLGPTNLIVIAMLSFLVRVFGYTIVPNTYAMLALEPLHGVTYACFMLATVHYLNAHVPMYMVSSAQGFMSSVCAVGSAVGAVVGGIVMDSPNGGVQLFRADSYVMASVLIMFLLSQMKARRQLAESPCTGHEPQAEREGA